MKRLVLLFISLAFLPGLWLRRKIGRFFGSRMPGTCVVLYYHMVLPEHRVLFGRQMDILLRLARPVAASHSAPLPTGVHHAAVTFDDGFENVFENALPELQARRIPSTWFIVSGALGKYPHWPTGRWSSAKSEKVLSAEQLRNLPVDLVAIGSHAVSHRALTKLDEGDAGRELAESRGMLEGILGRSVTLFSFPFGAMNSHLVECCRKSGYERVFSTSPELALSDPYEFVTARVPVEPTDWPLEFRLKLLGAYCWLPIAFSLKAAVFGSGLKPDPERRSQVNAKACSPSA